MVLFLEIFLGLADGKLGISVQINAAQSEASGCPPIQPITGPIIRVLSIYLAAHFSSPQTILGIQTRLINVIYFVSFWFGRVLYHEKR
jgi:hypothetical protein